MISKLRAYPRTQTIAFGITDWWNNEAIFSFGIQLTLSTFPWYANQLMLGATDLVYRPASITQALKLFGVISSIHEALASWVDWSSPGIKNEIFESFSFSETKWWKNYEISWVDERQILQRGTKTQGKWFIPDEPPTAVERTIWLNHQVQVRSFCRSSFDGRCPLDYRPYPT